MHITFAPKDEPYLKGLVEAGYYTNMTEAIRDAVRRMRDTYTQADCGSCSERCSFIRGR